MKSGILYKLFGGQSEHDAFGSPLKQATFGVNSEHANFGGKSKLDATDKSLAYRQVSFIHTKPNGEKKVRVVSGIVLNDLIIDFDKPLNEIALEVEQLLDIWMMQYSKEVTEQIGHFPNKGEVIVHEGCNHIDVVLNRIGSLGWLHIVDHEAHKLSRK